MTALAVLFATTPLAAQQASGIATATTVAPDGRADWRAPTRGVSVARAVDGRADWLVGRGSTLDRVARDGTSDSDGSVDATVDGTLVPVPRARAEASGPAPTPSPSPAPRPGPLPRAPRPAPAPAPVVPVTESVPRRDGASPERWLRGRGVAIGDDGVGCVSSRESLARFLRELRDPASLGEAGVSRAWTRLEPGCAVAADSADPPVGTPDLDVGPAELAPEALDIDVGSADLAPQVPDVDVEPAELVPEPTNIELGPAATPSTVPDIDLDPPSEPVMPPVAAPDELPPPRPDAADAAEGGQTPSDGGLFLVDDTVPAGFEALAEPQTLWVDVRFNERVVGTTAVTATAETIVFDAPAEVVAWLDDVEDPEQLVGLLSEPLPTNVDRVCFAEGDPPGCGRVEADPVAVIFDEIELGVDLFLAPALQAAGSRGEPLYLDPPERRASSVLSLHAAATDIVGREESFDVVARALGAYGAGHVSLAADHGTARGTRLNELRVTHNAAGHALTAGTWGWSPGAGWTDIDLLGIGFSTSFETRIDAESAFSSELVVFLQRRAIVQVLVDGRVLVGDSYPAGNQVIDTRALPEGTYPIEIRVVESDGTTRSEFRSFSKSALIPPRGEPVFGATAGIARVGDALVPERDDPLVAGFSLANRIDDRSAWRLGMLQVEDRSFAQGELVYLGERLSLQGGASVGGERTLAGSLRAGWTLPEGSLSVTFDRFSSDASVAEDDPLATLYPSERTRWSVLASHRLGRFALRASANRGRTRVGDGEARETTEYELGLRRPLVWGRGLRGFAEASIGERDEERFAALRLELFLDREQRTARVGTDAISDGRGGVDVGVAAGVGHRGRRAAFDWSADAYARAADVDSAGARLGLEHPLYRASASSDASRGGDGATAVSNVATASAYIGLDGDGAALGGGDFARAGVIVDVDGEPAGAPFDIVVNGVRVAGGTIGERRFIGLQPFESYAIKLVPQGVLSNGLGADVHEFTLYPGGVARITIVAEPQVLLVAMLVDESGEALGNAVVELGDNPQVSDADGIVQMEVVPGRALAVRAVDGRRCTLAVPEAEPGTEVLVPEEPLVCLAAEVASR